MGLWLWADEIPEMPIYEILIPNLKKSEWCGKKLCCWLIYWYHIGFVVKLWLLYYMTDLIAKTAYLSEVNGPLHWGRIYLTSDGIIISGIELMYGPIILDISFEWLQRNRIKSISNLVWHLVSGIPIRYAQCQQIA